MELTSNYMVSHCCSTQVQILCNLHVKKHILLADDHVVFPGDLSSVFMYCVTLMTECYDRVREN